MRTDSIQYDWSALNATRQSGAASATDQRDLAWIDRPFDPVVGSRHEPSVPRTEYLTPPPSTRKPLNPSAAPFVQVNASPSSIRRAPQMGRPRVPSESNQASWTWPRQSDAGSSEPGGGAAPRREFVAVYEDKELATPTRPGGTFSNLAASSADKPPRSDQRTLATRYVYLQNLLPSLNEDAFAAVVKVRLCQSLTIEASAL